MRARADAVLVGIETVLADDPSLTARDANGALLSRQPLRVVLDSRGRLPPQVKVANGSLPGRTLLATTPGGRAALPPLPDEAVEIWVGEGGPDGRIEPAELLAELGKRSTISVLVEAGGTVLAALLESRLVDEVVAFIAPKLVGGSDAPTPLGGLGVDEMSAAIPLIDVTYERVGADLLVRGHPEPCSPGS